MKALGDKLYAQVKSQDGNGFFLMLLFGFFACTNVLHIPEVTLGSNCVSNSQRFECL
jgi:hypothetical protein